MAIQRTAKKARSDWDRQNLAIALLVKAEPSKYGYLVPWARLVLQRLGPRQTELLLGAARVEM